MKTNAIASCWLLKFSSAYKHCPAEFMFISQVFWYIIMVSLIGLTFEKFMQDGICPQLIYENTELECLKQADKKIEWLSVE